MKMTGAVLREIGARRPYAESRPISIETVELDPPGVGEVLVRISGAGLCHSDLSAMDGSRPRPVPMLMGHEGAGEIVGLGTGVRDLQVGSPVVFQFSASCGRCVRCQAGRPQLCVAHAKARAAGELMGGGRRLRDASGVALAHQSGVSCFAEYTVVDRGSVVPIDRTMPMEHAAVFGCAVMTGAGAVLNTARMEVGHKVAIVGLGGVGFSGLMAARLAGAAEIIAIDINDSKLGLASQLGASITVNATDPDHVQQILDQTGGVDFAFEFAGSVAALQTAYAVTARGGEVIIAGLAPAASAFSFDPAAMVSDEKAIRGSYMGSCVPVRDIPRFIEMYQQGRLPVDKLISEQIGFEQINAGFDKLADGNTLRQILRPHDAA